MGAIGPCDCDEFLIREDLPNGGVRLQHGANPEHSIVFGPDIWEDAPVDAPHPRLVAWTDRLHARVVGHD